jgi:hypothetical protein
MHSIHKERPRTNAELEGFLLSQDIDFGPCEQRDPDTGRRVSMARREAETVRISFYLGMPNDLLSMENWSRICEELGLDEPPQKSG